MCAGNATPLCSVANYKRVRLRKTRSIAYYERVQFIGEGMEDKITLGKSDMRVTPLGVGAWAWGDPFFWGYGRGYGADDVRDAFNVSIEAGIDFFDTAEFYGFGGSELLVGKFVRETDRAVLIATKFFPYPWRLRKNDFVRALRGSLKRLGRARVDLYQIHWPSPPAPIETWVSALADAVEAGLVRVAGVSNYSANQMRRAVEVLAKRNIPLATNQVLYSLLNRNIERNGILQACRELGVTVIAYSPLAQGLLTGKYSVTNPPPGLRAIRYRGALARIAPLVDALKRIGEARGKTPAQVALNWTICKGTLPIPGAKNARQARENAGALGWQLSAVEIAALDEVSARIAK